MIGSAFDRAIETVFPGWARRRLLARAHCWLLRKSRAFEGGVNDRLSARKKPSTRGPNERNRESLETSRAQARELYRVNPFARGVVNSIVSNLIGCGIHPQARVVRPRLDILSETFNDQAERLWEEWAQHADLAGKRSIYELQEEIERELYVAGEVLVYVRPALDNRAVPLAIELIPSERLANVDHVLPGGGKVVQGVEFDSQGMIRAYHVWPEHPGDSFSFTAKPLRLPAERILHLHQTLEPGEVRGMTRFLTVAGTCEALMQWLDFVMAKERVASAFALMIQQDTPAFASLNTGDSLEDEDDEGNELSNLEGGMIFRGRVGESLSGVSSNIRGAEVDKLFTVFVRQIARGLDVRYELAARDLSTVTYLSARQGEREDRKIWEPQQEYLNRSFNVPVWRAFIHSAFSVGALTKPASAPMERFLEVEFIRPGWDWIDPQKEIQSDVLAIQAGLRSPVEVIAKRGGDAFKVLEDISRFRDWAQDFGLNLSIFGGGAPVAPSSEEEPVNGEEEDESDDNQAQESQEAAS